MELKNRFQALGDLIEDDVDSHWLRIREVFTATCQEELGEKNNQHKPWITQESLELIEERRLWSDPMSAPQAPLPLQEIVETC